MRRTVPFHRHAGGGPPHRVPAWPRPRGQHQHAPGLGLPHRPACPPPRATHLTASPRLHAVRLAWTASTAHEGYELWRAKRTPYPYFGGLPGEAAPYVWVADIDKNSLDYTDEFGGDSFAARGVYDYKLKAVDCVNESGFSGSAASTNYFLGDWAVPYDGGASAHRT
jgi:hypothetical protein